MRHFAYISASDITPGELDIANEDGVILSQLPNHNAYGLNRDDIQDLASYDGVIVDDCWLALELIQYLPVGTFETAVMDGSVETIALHVKERLGRYKLEALTTVESGDKTIHLNRDGTGSIHSKSGLEIASW